MLAIAWCLAMTSTVEVMGEYYYYILSIHIIFVVCWMAGLFYIVRLFIYHTEAQAKPEPDRSILSKQFEIMEGKLWWVIATPSMYLVIAAGLSMLFLMPAWLHQGWMHIKLTFVIGLIIYHFICQKKMNDMRNGIFKWSSTKLRIWNEVATIFLFAIVFLVVLKSSLNWIFGVVGIIAFSVIIMCAVKVYKHFREKKAPASDLPLKEKISKIKADIDSIIKNKCKEKFDILWYGAYDIDPKHLVFWVCVQSDSMKQELNNIPELLTDLKATLDKVNYPVEARPFVYIGFESQETVDRESKGNWQNHFK